VLRHRSLLKVGVGLAAFVPAGLIAYRLVTDRLGANPIVEALNQLGLWTLILLLACLACTPLKAVTGWLWPLHVRKLLGLCAFSYVCLHVGMYLLSNAGVDQFFVWDEIWKDIVKRKFITAGFAAFVLLIPLAVTSTSGMVRRLGFRRWKRLHRLIYAAAVLGVIHFIWRVKADTREPLIYGGILLVLFAVRIVVYLRGRRPPRAA
jgi:methionine sulfoxide reductase heme-binding subunit